jgi:hypothetical protein
MSSNGPDEVERWCDHLDADQREQVQRLRELIRTAHPGLDEAIRWGRPTFTAKANWHHWICAVAASRRGVQLVFHKGALLRDPVGLLSGENRYTRETPAARALAHCDAVAALLREAVERQEEVLES